MHGRGFREAIAPTGLVIDKVEYAADQIRITRRSRFRVSIYPNCCRPSARVHSRYHCTLADLLSHGRPVRITLVARRFRCATSRCTTRIFVERFPPDVTATFARRTARLDSIVHHLRLALGGRPAAALWLPFVRERDRAGSGASADHRGRYSHRGTDRPGAGIQVCRSPAALPAGPDIRPAGHPARPIHFGRLGRASGLVSAPLA